MLDILKSKILDNGWTDVETEVLDMKSLSTIADHTFTHVIANFCLPQPNPDEPNGAEKTVKEIWRVTKPGGVAVTTTWKGTCIALTMMSINSHTINRTKLLNRSR